MCTRVGGERRGVGVDLVVLDVDAEVGADHVAELGALGLDVHAADCLGPDLPLHRDDEVDVRLVRGEGRGVSD